MRAGLLKHIITIETVVESQSATGSVTEAWQKFAVVHSTYEPQTSGESFKEDQEQAFESVNFRIRFLDNITPKMRINYKGRIFDILSATDYLGMGKETHITSRSKA